MGYQTLWMMSYDSNNIIYWNKGKMIKQLIIDIFICLIYIIVYCFCPLVVDNYVQWIVLAIIIFLINLIISLVINLIFYKERVLNLINIALKKFHKVSKGSV